MYKCFTSLSKTYVQVFHIFYFNICNNLPYAQVFHVLSKPYAIIQHMHKFFIFFSFVYAIFLFCTVLYYNAPYCAVLRS
jgi:hypothetical protein